MHRRDAIPQASITHKKEINKEEEKLETEDERKTLMKQEEEETDARRNTSRK